MEWLSPSRRCHAAGNRFSVEHIHSYRVKDGQLIEHWVVRDDLGMMLEVGAIPLSELYAT